MMGLQIRASMSVINYGKLLQWHVSALPLSDPAEKTLFLCQKQTVIREKKKNGSLKFRVLHSNMDITTGQTGTCAGTRKRDNKKTLGLKEEGVHGTRQ
jgi:hypothetical protein